MSAAVARGHGDDGGGDDPSRPLPRPIGLGCRGFGEKNSEKFPKKIKKTAVQAVAQQQLYWAPTTCRRGKYFPETVKDMTAKFRKFNKFEGSDFRRWQKKMHFLLTTLKVVYVLSTPMPEFVEDETLDQMKP
ncbi:hypothetical protein Tco_1017820 [Tanacetum coccineum]|uniref:Zinc finger, CCHC-type n=1 Tax=Tanacetum coccineum TaxID=301880 RepID=A0ABQ5FSR5_9ASTR